MRTKQTHKILTKTLEMNNLKEINTETFYSVIYTTTDGQAHRFTTEYKMDAYDFSKDCEIEGLEVEIFEHPANTIHPIEIYF